MLRSQCPITEGESAPINRALRASQQLLRHDTSAERGNKMNGLWQRLRQTARPLVLLRRAALQFVFPSSCPLCHADVADHGGDPQRHTVSPMLCGLCLGDVHKLRENRCRKCGMPIGPYLPSDKGCPKCDSQKFRFQQVIRLGLYDGTLRHACIRAKATTQFPLAAALANLLWLSEKIDLQAAQVDLVAPVPCHWTRRLLRPHHAAETIARVLAWRMKKPLHRTLLRKRRLTPDQSTLGATQRRLNLREAFVVQPRPQLYANKTVLLVDDILTTGSTANECARTLLRAGAKQVIVAVIAVVP